MTPSTCSMHSNLPSSPDLGTPPTSPAPPSLQNGRYWCTIPPPFFWFKIVIVGRDSRGASHLTGAATHPSSTRCKRLATVGLCNIKRIMVRWILRVVVCLTEVKRGQAARKAPSWRIWEGLAWAQGGPLDLDLRLCTRVSSPSRLHSLSETHSEYVSKSIQVPHGGCTNTD